MLPALSFPVATETAVRKLYNQGGQQGGVFWFYQNRWNIVTKEGLRYYRIAIIAIIDYLSSLLVVWIYQLLIDWQHLNNVFLIFKKVVITDISFYHS